MSPQLPHLRRKKTPTLLASVNPTELKSIRGVCLDIDDTLSTEGKLEAEAYSALWKLKQAGLVVVPITGRPAGWCDHFARFWPIDAIVGENGAFTFFMERDPSSSPHKEKSTRFVRKKILTPSGSDEATLKTKLSQLALLIQQKFPHAQWASDQSYREFDLAIDICEDVPTWDQKDVKALLSLCHQQGAHAKLSSIHVNTWFGKYDKRKGFENWLNQGAPGCSLRPIPQLDEWLYIGDSPNDEPMFEWFPLSVGVANIKQYLEQLNHPPLWITDQPSGAGFVQMTELLLKARAKKLE